jgi:hypothetical protein
MLCQPRWKEEVEWHINVRKIVAALETLETMMRQGMCKAGMRIMLGVANTTAISWLRSGWAKDKSIQPRLTALLEELKTLGVELYVIHRDGDECV